MEGPLVLVSPGDGSTLPAASGATWRGISGPVYLFFFFPALVSKTDDIVVKANSFLVLKFFQKPVCMWRPIFMQQVSFFSVFVVYLIVI